MSFALEMMNFALKMTGPTGNYIMQSVGMARWGNHSKIVEILLFCEHPDIEVPTPGNMYT